MAQNSNITSPNPVLFSIYIFEYLFSTSFYHKLSFFIFANLSSSTTTNSSTPSTPTFHTINHHQTKPPTIIITIMPLPSNEDLALSTASDVVLASIIVWFFARLIPPDPPWSWLSGSWYQMLWILSRSTTVPQSSVGRLRIRSSWYALLFRLFRFCLLCGLSFGGIWEEFEHASCSYGLRCFWGCSC